MDQSTHSRPLRQQPLPEAFPGVHAMDSEEEEAVLRVCRSRSLFRYYGIHPQQEVKQFEGEFAHFLGVRHALAVTSGTTALQVALAALQVGPGQEVIVPAYLWVSVVAAVVNMGAIPVLAEIDETFGLDVDDVSRRITPRTAGMIVVHMSGAPANIVPLAALARERGIFVVEDCAQCVGGHVAGQPVGTFGDMGIYSFQANKNMSSGEAGAVVTNDPVLAARAIASHDLGYARDHSDQLLVRDSQVSTWGRGCRLDELRAAVLRVQLRKLPVTVRRMQSSNQIIRRALERAGIHFRSVADPQGDTGSFLILVHPDEASARRVVARSRWHGIACSCTETSNTVLIDYGLHIYSNIPSLVLKHGSGAPGFPWSLAENSSSVYEYGPGSCPVSDALFRRSQLLAIPSCLDDQDEQDVIAGILDGIA
ncbi:MAG: aminotransferase class I/II-fold pyridoxal phosphate-dependent enzyme [Acidobacteriota bacterium]